MSILAFLLFCCSSVYSSQRISITSLDNYWKMNVGYYAQVSITPKETLKEMSRTVIFFGLSNAITDNNGVECKKNILHDKKNIAHLSFSSLANVRNTKYTFNNAQIYMIKNDRKYKLQPVNSENNNVDQTTSSINNGRNRSHYFRLPLVCSELDDTMFEILGIYKNGIEYPLIKFKIHLLK